ncbi:MAG: hypothetical protein KQJ78_15745 [Deltaproteobacteria bacterium]|nr:hypothetical protein [Deltaproteobacteria bacterium]
MDLEIRELTTPAELEEVVRLQMLVGGLPERHVTSPITLKTLTLPYPRVGLALGAFAGERLVGFTLSFYAAQPELAFGFMLIVDPEFQNLGAGGGVLPGQLLSPGPRPARRPAGMTPGRCSSPS